MKIKAKTLIALLLVLSMAFSLAACGKGNQSEKSPPAIRAGTRKRRPSSFTPRNLRSLAERAGTLSCQASIRTMAFMPPAMKR